MRRIFVSSFIISSIVPVLVFAAPAPACINLTRSLAVGSRGSDVVQLQNYLISQNFLSAGLSTGYFGSLTQAAVKSYQSAQGIVSSGTPTTTGYGAVGPRTRAALAQCQAQTTPQVPSTPAPVTPTPPVVPPTPPVTPPAPPVVEITPVIPPSGSPLYASIAADQKSMTLAAFKFHPELEAINLNQIGLTLTSGSTGDLNKLTLWANIKVVNGVLVIDPTGILTLIGSATPIGTAVSMIAVLPQQIQIPKNQDSTIWVAGDIAMIGTGFTAQSGDLIKVDLDAANTKATGQDSSRSISVGGSTASPGKRIFKSVPTITYATDSGVAHNGPNDLLVLKVAADPKGDVTLGKLSFTISLTNATASSFTLSGPNGRVHSAISVTPSGSNLVVQFDNSANAQDASIAGGMSKTYTLRVDDLALSTTSGSISAALKSDSTFSGITTETALSGANLIWSPDSFGSPASPSVSDWANGFGIPGCIMTSGSGADCFPRVLWK